MQARQSTLMLFVTLTAPVWLLPACSSPSVATNTPAPQAAARSGIVERGLSVDTYALVRDRVLPPNPERGPELGGVARVKLRPDEIEAGKPWADRCPEDGLILTMVARALPRELTEDSRVPSLCLFDRVWCTRDEARSLVPAEPRVGDVATLPPGFAERLARFHLLDREAGVGQAFQGADVSASALAFEVLSMHDSVVRLSFTGELVAEDATRRMASRVRGSAAWDYELGTFTSFELVADGASRPSPSAANTRRLGFVFLLSRSPTPELLPPRFIELYEPFDAVESGAASMPSGM